MDEDSDKQNQQQNKESNLTARGKNNFHSSDKTEFKNYVFQFLMVFLGITAGFFVENIRENYVESKKAEEYAGSLYEDLVADTANLHHAINVSLLTVQRIDTLLSLLNQEDASKITGGELYYYGALSLRYQNFIPNKSTINQLISTGSIQYFKNYSIEKSIADYNQALLILNYQQETENQTYMEKVKFIETIFDGNIFSQVLYKDLTQNFINSFLNKNYRLLTYNKKELKEFANFCEFRKQFLIIKANDMYKNPLNKAVSLINELKKEYNFK
ncbi:MAG: hypothetical protein WCE54_00625 [Ignavibacteriaceae bacterium]